jgi:hypothetical protein
VAAASSVAISSGAEAVVVKRGAWGCTVVARDGAGDLTVTHIGARPTPRVWPIGSGDVFAAAFAHGLSVGASPVEAGNVGSNAAAWWCSTQVLPVPAEILAGSEVSSLVEGAQAALTPSIPPPTIYLAAPFFTLGERWVVETARTALFELGALVFSPLHDVGAGGDEVATKDLAGLRDATGIFAVLDGWDPGTLYETGWAHHAELPVIGFTHQPGFEGSKMLVGSGAELHSDLPTALYHAVWAAMGAKLTPGRRAEG